MVFVSYQPGEIVIREGDIGDAFYIINSGLVAVSKKLGQQDTALCDLSPGSYFGELALLNKSPRSATITAIEPVTLLKLSKHDFMDAMSIASLGIVKFVQWQNSEAKPTEKQSTTPAKLSRRATTDTVFQSSALEKWRLRKVKEYEVRLRRLSTAEKVFMYFATVELDDGSMMMSPTDFLHALGVLQADCEIDSYGKKFFQEADADGDGMVSFEEFVFFRSLLRINPADFKLAFQMFDTNSDGSFDQNEFASMFATLSGSKKEASFLTDGGGAMAQLFGAQGDRSMNFSQFSEWLQGLQTELARLELLNYSTIARGDTNTKVDRLYAIDFGNMIVDLAEAAGYSTRSYRQRVSMWSSNNNQITIDEFMGFLVRVHVLLTAQK